MEKKWLVFYTKSRAEKKVDALLNRFGFESFLPLNKVVRQWSDRKKKLEVPLFNSYIFVKDLESSIPEILKTPGISWNIRHNDKPAIIHQSELDTIQRFLTSGMLLETTSLDNLEKGDRVKVIDGPLRGAVGVLAGSHKDQKFTVFMESIGQAIRVNLPHNLLKKLTF